MDNKYTPADKIKSISKAFTILQNSITFCSGKKELGVDDTIKPLIYILKPNLKAFIQIIIIANC